MAAKNGEPDETPGKGPSFYLEEANECVRLARRAPKGHQAQFLRLAKQWMAIALERNGFIVRNDRDEPLKPC